MKIVIFTMPGIGLLACLMSACTSDEPGPRVQAESEALFEHFIVDPQPPGGAECCTDVVAAGDIDGDGYRDIVIGGENAEAAGLVWYEYPTWQRHAVDEGQFTTDGTVVDFDKDGDQDIVVGDTSRGLVFAENLGAGSRWASRVLVPGQYAHDIEVGDLDADGDMDVAIADKKIVRIYIFENLSVEETVTPLQQAGEGLQMADLDGDGDLDLLYSHLWLEQGGGEWVAHDIAPSWTADTRTVAAHINGDGAVDVVLSGSEGDAGLSWFESPASEADPWIEHSISDDVFNGVHSLGVTDLDGDNLPDVVAAEMHTSPKHRIVVFRQKDNGWEPLTLALHGSHNMIVSDLDQDGDADLVGKNYAGPAARFLELWQNRSADLALVPGKLQQKHTKGGWQYRPVTTNRPEHDGYKFGSMIADVNDDRRPDVVAGGTVYVNSGSPSWAEWPAVPISNAGDIIHVLPAASDGWHWMLAVDANSLLLLSAASPDGRHWQAEKLAALPQGRVQGYVASAPPAGRGYVFYFTKGRTLQRLHIPGETAGDWILTQLRDDVEESGVAVADLDRDGDTDLVVVEASGRRLMLLETDGHELRAHKAGASLHWIDRLAVADLDGDGRLDIVYTEESQDRQYTTHVRWIKAPADPWSTPWRPHTIVTLRSANSLGVVDFDGDGDSDIVVAEHTDLRAGEVAKDNFTGVFLNQGDASWVLETVEIGPHSSHIGARTADLDGDDDLDIVSVGWQQTCCVHAWVNPSGHNE